jgi:hypothetical protein
VVGDQPCTTAVRLYQLGQQSADGRLGHQWPFPQQSVVDGGRRCGRSFGRLVDRSGARSWNDDKRISVVRLKNNTI